TLQEHSRFQGRGSPTVSISFSPDGKWLASGDHEGVVKLWEVSPCRLRFSVIHTPQRAVHSLKFAPDGAGLASGCSDSTIKIWDTRTGQELNVLRGHQDAVSVVSFGPDGQR